MSLKRYTLLKCHYTIDMYVLKQLFHVINMKMVIPHPVVSMNACHLYDINGFEPNQLQGGTSFVDLLCFCSVLCLLCLCARLIMCFVVTCWERADLLALVCGVYCEFVTFPLVSWVRCGT